jgi:hypothetical protein
MKRLSFQNTVQGDSATVLQAETIHYHAPKARKKSRPTQYPDGCIGADLLRRNYIKYLVERYHRYKEADASFGKTAKFSYAVIYKNIETRFHAPTFFVPVSRFDELVDYLQGRIDQTILGKRNVSRSTSNYRSMDEYADEQALAVTA